MSLRGIGLSARYGSGPLVLDKLDIEVAPGQTLGVAGLSGCGKSTLARVLALLHPAAEGRVEIDGTPVRGARHRAPARLRRRVGIVFQSPRSAVDPRWRLDEIVAEPLRLSGQGRSGPAAKVESLAEQVGLDPALLARRPHQVSDGQLQRACLARAIALDPAYLVCDEMTAMLDASSAAGFVAQIRDWQRRTGAGVLAISHDQALLQRWTPQITHLTEVADSALLGAPT